MAEHTPVVKMYRDALEAVISATMEFMARSNSTTASPQPHPERWHFHEQQEAPSKPAIPGPARGPSPLRLRLLAAEPVQQAGNGRLSSRNDMGVYWGYWM
jgi:hypothetical protein